MDPYLEAPALWPDVHHGLISESQAVLNRELRPRYHVRVEERVYISDDEDPGRNVIIPDLRVAQVGHGVKTRHVTQPVSSGRAVAPIEMTTLVQDEIREARLEVVDTTDRSVVTVIEFISPSNKVSGSRGRASFEQTRREVMNSASHWVEIHLLRAGRRFVNTRRLAPHDYLIHVSRVERRPQGSVWPLALRDSLPAVPIPLRGSDASADLDLQAVLNAAYERGAYDLEIDYRKEPVPPLVDEHAAWVAALLKEKSLR